MKPLSKFLACVATVFGGLLFCSAIEAQEKRYRASESVDDISGETSHSVGLIGEDGKSLLLLGVRKGKQPVLTLSPGATIFPDESDINNKRMSVDITMRSTTMAEPVTRSWRMLWMDYKSAHLMLPAELAKQVLEGESVTFRFDKVGKRFRFVTSGDGMDGLGDAVNNVLQHAITADELAAREQETQRAANEKRVDALLEKHEKEKEAASRTAERNAARLAELKWKVELQPVNNNGQKAGKELATKLGVALRKLSADDIIERAAKAADKIGFKDKDDPKRAAYVDGFVAAMTAAKESLRVPAPK